MIVGADPMIIPRENYLTRKRTDLRRSRMKLHNTAVNPREAIEPREDIDAVIRPYVDSAIALFTVLVEDHHRIILAHGITGKGYDDCELVTIVRLENPEADSVEEIVVPCAIDFYAGLCQAVADELGYKCSERNFFWSEARTYEFTRAVANTFFSPEEAVA
jgi:hypothetical protein